MSYAADLIKQSISDFKLQKSKKRRRKIEKLLDYYTGGDSIHQYIAPYFNAKIWKEVPLYSVNFTKLFIDKLSRVYREKPIRTIGSSTNNIRYTDSIQRKDVFMKHLERMVRLLDVVAINVSYDTTKEKLTHTPIYYFDAFFDDFNPYDPIAICYPILSPTEDPSYTEKVKYAYFDAERKVIYDEDGNVMSEEIHNYGRLPFIFPRRLMQIDDFYGEGATDITSVNEHISITMTELQLGSRFQAFGQPWASGLYEDQTIARTGPDEIIILPEGATFGIESPNPKIKEMIDSIKFQIEMLGMTHHLSVTFESSQDRPSSGLALVIKDYDRLEYYKDDVEWCRDMEHQMYDLERTVAEANGKYLPSDFTVEFIESEYPKTTQDQITKDEWQLSNNLTTMPEIMQRLKGDITLKQAEQQIKSNKKINEINVRNG